MRLVGAKNGFIRWPFFLEGAWIGLIGSIIPVAIMYFGYKTIYGALNKSLVSSNYSMISPAQFVPEISLLLVAIGVIIGSFGSIMAMRRFLKL